MWTRIKNYGQWLKWTVCGCFLPDRNALSCGHYEGKHPPHHPKGECPDERPGSDDQWGQWVETNTAVSYRPQDMGWMSLPTEYHDAVPPPRIKVDATSGEWLVLCSRCNEYCELEDSDMSEVAALGGRHVMVCGMCRKGRGHD
jgi:hypothetical protein